MFASSANAASLGLSPLGLNHRRNECQKVSCSSRLGISGACLRASSNSTGKSRRAVEHLSWTEKLVRDGAVFLGTAALCLASSFVRVQGAGAETPVQVEPLQSSETTSPVDVPSNLQPQAVKTGSDGDAETLAGSKSSQESTQTVLQEFLKKVMPPKKDKALGKRKKVPARVVRAMVYEKNVKAAMKKIEEQPESVPAHLELLELRMEHGDVVEGISVLDKLLQLQPDFLEFRFMRARAYSLVGDLERSREEFHKLVESEPLSVIALQGLVMTLDEMSVDNSVILEIIRDAIRNAEEKQELVAARNFKMLLGQILTMQEKLTEAVEQYEQLIKEDPADFRPHLCQGLLYDTLGKKEEAKESYKKFKELCPESFPKRKFLDDLIVKGKLVNSLHEEEKTGEAPVQMQQPSPLFSKEDTLVKEENE